MKRKIRIIGCLCLMSLILTAFEVQGEKPPFSPIRVTGEVLGGTAGAIIGIIPGALLAKREEKRAPYSDMRWVAFVDELLLTGLGYTVGSATGVYLVGSIGNEKGDFLTTLVFSLLGWVGGAVIGSVVGIVDEDIGGLVFFTGPPIGATIGFNLTREYKSRPALADDLEGPAPPVYFELVRVRF